MRIKRILSALLIILLLWGQATVIAESNPHVTFSISCDGNLFFSKYDVEIYLDSQKLELLKHGKTTTKKCEISKGHHTLWFYKKNEHKINGSFEFDVTGEMNISCNLHCRNNRIEVNKQSVKEVITPTPVPTPSPTPVPPYEVIPDKTSLIVKKGETDKITVEINNYTEKADPTYKWLSSDSHIASCTDGIIMGRSSGKTTVSCIVNFPNGYEITKDIQVYVYVPVESITSDSKDITLNVGKQLSPIYTVLPDDATEKGLRYESSDPYVASVNSDGLIAAIAPGQATITATSVDGSDKTNSIKILVVDNRGSLGNNVASIPSQSAQIVCNMLNEQLPHLKVFARRPALASITAALTANQLIRSEKDFVPLTNKDDSIISYIGLSVVNQEELYMAFQDQDGLFWLVSVIPANNTIIYSKDRCSKEEAEDFISESCHPFFCISSNEIDELTDTIASIENP